MFLDEELELIFKKDKSIEDRICEALETMVERVPKLTNSTDSINPYLNGIKMVDGSWRLFCKRNNIEWANDTWREFVLQTDKNGVLKKYLRW